MMRISKHKLYGRRKGGYKRHSKDITDGVRMSRFKQSGEDWEARMEQQKTGVMKTEVELKYKL